MLYNGFFNAVYGRPNGRVRKDLWNVIKQFTYFVIGNWILMGDLNSYLFPKNKKGGRSAVYIRCKDFLDCLHECQLVDLESIGFEFNWEK